MRPEIISDRLLLAFRLGDETENEFFMAVSGRCLNVFYFFFFN